MRSGVFAGGDSERATRGAGESGTRHQTREKVVAVYALPHVTLLPVASREMLPAEVDRLNIHKDERGCRGPQAPAFGLGGKM